MSVASSYAHDLIYGRPAAHRYVSRLPGLPGPFGVKWRNVLVKESVSPLLLETSNNRQRSYPPEIEQNSPNSCWNRYRNQLPPRSIRHGPMKFPVVLRRLMLARCQLSRLKTSSLKPRVGFSESRAIRCERVCNRPTIHTGSSCPYKYQFGLKRGCVAHCL